MSVPSGLSTKNNITQDSKPGHDTQNCNCKATPPVNSVNNDGLETTLSKLSPSFDGEGQYQGYDAKTIYLKKGCKRHQM